ncbi:MAG: four helix bundle protein [Armatimonadia bacterium]
MPTFTELRVWREAYNLSLSVFRATEAFPKSQLYCLTSQMQRAAISVGANIAEGQKRHTRKDFSNFLSMAEGSLAEVQHYLMLSHDLEFLNDSSYEALMSQSEQVEKMLFALQRSLLAQSPRPR